MLKGQALLNEVSIRTAQGMTKSELCRACGYEIDGRLHFTDFYTELMIAKGMNIPDPIECDDDDNQDIADQLLETYSSEAVSAFIELFGEECLEDFEESYQGEMSGPEFAEMIVTDCYGMHDVPHFVEIDWQATWDNLERHDYSEEDGFIFCHNF